MLKPIYPLWYREGSGRVEKPSWLLWNMTITHLKRGGIAYGAIKRHWQKAFYQNIMERGISNRITRVFICRNPLQTGFLITGLRFLRTSLLTAQISIQLSMCGLYWNGRSKRGICQKEGVFLGVEPMGSSQLVWGCLAQPEIQPLSHRTNRKLVHAIDL